MKRSMARPSHKPKPTDEQCVPTTTYISHTHKFILACSVGSDLRFRIPHDGTRRHGWATDELPPAEDMDLFGPVKRHGRRCRGLAHEERVPPPILQDAIDILHCNATCRRNQSAFASKQTT